MRWGEPAIEGAPVPASATVGAVTPGDSGEEIARECGITEEHMRPERAGTGRSGL
jgi:hypothetical protein